MKHAKATIQMLLVGGQPIGPAQWRRQRARSAWLLEMEEKWTRALRTMDDRLTAIVDRVSEEEFERLCDEEQAKVDAIRAQLEDVAYNQKWPRHLYWGGI